MIQDRIVVFQAKKIITMDPNNPFTTHVAVQDGKILATGNLDDVSCWGKYELNQDFKSSILTPGFIEGHSHAIAGGIWNYLYLGYQDRIDPNGVLWEGLKTPQEVLDQIIEHEKKLKPDEPLIGWGFDPIFFNGAELNQNQLNQVNQTRPIVIIHSNFHLLTVNGVSLELAGYSENSDVEGLQRDENQKLTGVILEMSAMFPILRRLDIQLNSFSFDRDALFNFGKVCVHAGVTTATDLYAHLGIEEIKKINDIVHDDTFPIRFAPAPSVSGDIDQYTGFIHSLSQYSSDKLFLGQVKIMTDGSIQGYTAKLKWPYYFKAQNNGMWNMPPESIERVIEKLHEAKIQMHIHANGDQAIEFVIGALKKAMKKSHFLDHRHVIQHCQMATEENLQEMSKLCVCANFFANHIYFFGDQHIEITLGKDRASRLNPIKSALEHRIPVSVHTDAPVTPLSPLTSAWSAMNRMTYKGEVLGQGQKIDLDSALRAITIGAAYTLKKDHIIGSIKIGKYADFTILEKDPYEEDSSKLKDIKVLGTVLAGKANLV